MRVDALCDDLNVPAAIAAMHEAARAGAYPALLSTMTLLGIARVTSPARRVVQSVGADHATASVHGVGEAVEARIAELLRERIAARGQRDFVRADSIREGLVAAGIKVMDRPGADTEWEPAPDFDPAKLAAIE